MSTESGEMRLMAEKAVWQIAVKPLRSNGLRPIVSVM